MNKQLALQSLRNAKSAHLQWRARAQALVAGVELDESSVPVVHTDCKFGQWYYGPGQDLASLPTFRAIDTPHELLHAVYMKIFRALHGKDTRNALQKLFGKKVDFDANRLAEAKSYMGELIDVSRTLLEIIEQLEKEIKEMDDAEFEALG